MKGMGILGQNQEYLGTERQKRLCVMLNHFVRGRLKKVEVREGTVFLSWKENSGNTQVLHGSFASVFTKI